MRPLTLYLILSLSCLSGCFKSIYEPSYKYAGYETSDTNYFNGQILLPDQIHDNFLIVVDADKMNWCMEYYDIASDGDIQDVLNAYCAPLFR